jgi:membrane associated rhomboid family serine protease
MNKHLGTLAVVVEAEALHCYRHPDRETRVSCSECGRGVCPDCMVFAPVGIRCLDHAAQGKSKRAPIARMPRRMEMRRRSAVNDPAIVTKVLIGLNVGVFLINLAQGASLGQNAGSLYIKWLLIAKGLTNDGPIGVAEGEWWRLLTAAFLHGSIIHLAFNMLFLWIIGSPMEAAIGRARFIGLYFVSALAGSAGALVAAPLSPTVGASGALFGLLGAAIVFEQQGFNVLGGSALSIAVINLIITFTIPNISIGGHVGGLIGGIVCGLALTRFGKGHAAYGRLDAASVAAIVGVGVGSVLISYFKVRGYT